MFALGDKVVHPVHGAGIIEDIEVKDFLGEKKNYFVLKILACNMKIMVPCDGVEATGLRKIISSDDCQKVYDVLEHGVMNQELAKEMPGAKWNYRHRILLDKIKSGNVFDLADIVRVLSLRNYQKPLSGGEKKLLDQAKSILTSELSMVDNISTDAVEKRINEIVLPKTD